MNIKDIVSIISGGLITFLLWRILITFIEPANLLMAFPCSIVGGYIAGRLRTNGIPSGAASGLVAGFIVVIYMGGNYGDWQRSIMFGAIIVIIWVIGGGLGELISNIGNKK